MRDTLPRKRYLNECAIVNLDDVKGRGTHWVAFKKRGVKVVYYDSFGNLTPPLEIVKYLSGCSIIYNY